MCFYYFAVFSFHQPAPLFSVLLGGQAKRRDFAFPLKNRSETARRVFSLGGAGCESKIKNSKDIEAVMEVKRRNNVF